MLQSRQQNDWLCETEDDKACEEKEILNIFRQVED